MILRLDALSQKQKLSSVGKRRQINVKSSPIERHVPSVMVHYCWSNYGNKVYVYCFSYTVSLHLPRAMHLKKYNGLLTVV